MMDGLTVVLAMVGVALATAAVAVLSLALAGLVYALAAIPVYFAWKLVAVAAFSAPALGFWQIFAGCWGLGVIFGLAGRVRKAV